MEEEAPVRLEKIDSWTGMLWWRASVYGHISKTEPTKFTKGLHLECENDSKESSRMKLPFAVMKRQG